MISGTTVEPSAAPATHRHAARDVHVLLRDLPEYHRACACVGTRDVMAKAKFTELTPRVAQVLDAAGWETLGISYADRTGKIRVEVRR